MSILIAARVAAARVRVERREGVVLFGDKFVVVDEDEAVGPRVEVGGVDGPLAPAGAVALESKRVWRRVGGGIVVVVVL